MIAIRGAITVNCNAREEILHNTELLLQEMMRRNQLENEQIISIIFTATKDLDQVYPAVSARNIGITEAALMCTQELYIEGSLEKCIRIMISAECNHKQSEAQHVYLKGAKKLRPDLADRRLYIAIDGPAGAGKSTIAKMLAQKIGLNYVDTGAMYRTIGYGIATEGIDINNEFEVEKALQQMKIEVKYVEGQQEMYLNGERVTDKIRTQEMGEMASKVAMLKPVRELLVAMQRNIANAHEVVMDGRDIGTHVLPDAPLKIYLTATPEERAQRRVDQMKIKGIICDFEEVVKEICNRDKRDMNRAFAPLEKAKDALEIDTTDLTIGQVIGKIEELI